MILVSYCLPTVCLWIIMNCELVYAFFIFNQFWLAAIVLILRLCSTSTKQIQISEWSKLTDILPFKQIQMLFTYF